MSIMKIAHIKNANSYHYRKIIHPIYLKFDDLYKTMKTYAINDSLTYIYLAYKCFEKEVIDDFNRNHL